MGISCISKYASSINWFPVNSHAIPTATPTFQMSAFRCFSKQLLNILKNCGFSPDKMKQLCVYFTQQDYS